MIKRILWILPFCSFLAGYYILHFFFHINELKTPLLIGKHIHEAVCILSDSSLNTRILNEKEDPTLIPGTIISQQPAAGQKIKPYQSVFLVIAKKPALRMAPVLITKTRTTIEQEAIKEGISVKFFALSSPYPTDTCIAQIPSAHEPLINNSIIAYISDDKNTSIIWPNFKHKTIKEVQEFLQLHGLCAEIRSNNALPYDDTTPIIAQHPLAGTLTTLHQLSTIQLQVN